MTAEDRLLLRNLLERLEADAASERPLLRRYVSDSEREALRSLLEHVGIPASGGVTGQHEKPAGRDSGGSEFVLNKSALRLDAPQNPEWTLCLDFGTAKSKAFAASEGDPPQLKPLPIGRADNDVDEAVHDVSSSIWITDDGLLFVGSEAVKRGAHYGESMNRRRLDSLKQEISQVSPLDGGESAGQRLPPEVDPTATLTYGDAITIYLAYLTDLAASALEEDSLSRYVRRRFTVPWWSKEQRRWAGDLLSTAFGRAQLLADTFHGQWGEGIDVGDVKRAVVAAAAHDEEMLWIVADESREGILEALAAASARLWTDQSARDVTLVVDVGAGTTDVSLFCVFQDSGRVGSSGDQHNSFPIMPSGDAIRQGGDQLDSLLVAEVMRRAGLGEDVSLKRRVIGPLNLQKRRLKETLFKTGTVAVELVNDEVVTISEDEFLKLDGIKKFEQSIVDTIQKFLDETHDSWAKAVKNHITLVLTGGGCDLPMIRNLENRTWTLGGKRVSCRVAARVPGFEGYHLEKEFVEEYPRLAVAMGGALDMLLDEKAALREFMGGTPAPGPLDSFPTRGE